MIYEQDDIRLCTMQRAIPEQRLGISCDYDKRHRSHFIKLTEDVQSTLAIRAGIKHYDRVISFNGVNIEHETFNQLMDRFDLNRNAPVQILVCSPATYVHYKTHKMRLHNDLPTVQRLKPVYATSSNEPRFEYTSYLLILFFIASDSNTDRPAVSIDKDSFCVVQWENTNMIAIVPQSTIFKSPEFACVNDICIIETEGQYRKGNILLIGHLFSKTILFKTNIFVFSGSYSDCENLKKISMMKTHGEILYGKILMDNDRTFLDTIINVNADVVKAKSVYQVNTPDVCLTLEQLPNELFLHLFTYLNLHDLYSAFWRLNTRINNLFSILPKLVFDF